MIEYEIYFMENKKSMNMKSTSVDEVIDSCSIFDGDLKISSFNEEIASRVNNIWSNNKEGLREALTKVLFDFSRKIDNQIHSYYGPNKDTVERIKDNTLDEIFSLLAKK